ncbi:unnamed protein product, partial [Mesorhabditis spiculigera]
MRWRRSLVELPFMGIILFILALLCDTALPIVVLVKNDELPFPLLDAPMVRGRRNLAPAVSEPLDVCETRIIPDHSPKFGHMHNGSRVEIQQDNYFHFTATFVECVSEVRDRFISECVTMYEHRPAGVRLVGYDVDFIEASIRVPIGCSCKVRKILHPFHYRPEDK